MPRANLAQLAAALSLAAATILAPTARAGSAGWSYLAEVDDLPLAPGLVELPNGTLFDAPQGRIVEATAEARPATAASGAEVHSFYEAVLPQLGWKETGNLAFARDRERLTIEIDDARRPLAVHFSLRPLAGANPNGN